MRYRRYKEAPQYYGVGRTCVLKLWERIVECVEEAGEVVRGLVVDGGRVE